ncbi:MAG: DNA-3-methyladenine glycosylase I [Candidatus Hermodarchaeota archaeon]
MVSEEMIKRCEWANSNALMKRYHDKEWGTPEHNDQMLFEFLILEGMQAGLSWNTILQKRENFRKAFDNFDVKKIANYNEVKLDELLQNKGIIRNRLKIEAAITNAKTFIKLQNEFESFNNYIWSYVDYKPIHNSLRNLKDIPTTTLLSDTISKDLKKRGFKFVGSTIIYAYLQAIGIINDHLTYCFRYNELLKNY